ncbi:MAG: hypothetical protein U0Q07_08185 [Acidimicrobiales bacterium]
MGFFGFLLFGFIGLIPFGLGVLLAFICGIVLFPLDLMQRRWLVKEFERLIRRPSWSAAAPCRFLTADRYSCSEPRVASPVVSRRGRQRR